MLSDDLLHVHTAATGERALVKLPTLRDAGYRVRVVCGGRSEPAAPPSRGYPITRVIAGDHAERFPATS
jgi:hypothetical protein